jgi:hypothetical protein
MVPSAVLPPSLQPGEILTDERNVLPNPRHASVRSWRVVEAASRLTDSYGAAVVSKDGAGHDRDNLGCLR